ncbi:MAG: MFS transporter [Clostridia bacterium]|nr:MFS transporter [Clostridia bacterium]
MKENHNRYFLQNILYSTANMMIAGSVVQGFLLESGVNESVVTWYLSLVQIIQVSVMMGFSLVIDRIRNVIRAFALSMLCQTVLFFSLILLCLFQGIPVTEKYLLVFSAGIITNVSMAIHNVLLYKSPYLILDMSDYARLTGTIGVAVGAGCIVVSAAMSFFLSRFEYYVTMLCFFLVGVAALFGSFLLTCRYKVSEGGEENAPKRITAKKAGLFRYRPFTLLILPNLFRGFCAGILTVAMTVGHIEGVTESSSGAVLTLLLQIGNVLSSLIYALLARRAKNSSMILLSSGALLLFMPAMLIKPDLSLFYTMFFFANFFLNIINNAVPVSVTKFVDYEYVGQYSSWRMLLHTAGGALAGVAVTPMLSMLGGAGTLGLGAALQVISGIGYYLFLRKSGTEKKEVFDKSPHKT